MKARIETIRYLASRELQEQYIVNGTVDEYLLPEELVNDALEFARLVEEQKIGSSLNAHQRGLLAELKHALEAVNLDGGKTNFDLVANDLGWSAMRDAAQNFLASYEANVDRTTG